MTLRIIVRGGGDLASGVVLRLHRAGWQVIVTELAQPKAVRRYVSYAQAVYDGRVTIEETVGRKVITPTELDAALAQGEIPVIVDPQMAIAGHFKPHILADCRMLKQAVSDNLAVAQYVIGLGPGFTAGEDCDAVIETNRGPYLGRVIWSGRAQDDTRIPERVGEYCSERVLRSPAAGIILPSVQIGDRLKAGQRIAEVNGLPVNAPFDGVLRGLIHKGIEVEAGEKIGDVDPRGDERLCWLVSDKALAIGGGVIEAILSLQALRPVLYSTEVR